MSGRRRGGTTGGGDVTEAEARKAAEARGWRLEKDGKVFRLVDATTGTLVAGDWADPPDYYGLSLADVGTVLEPHREGRREADLLPGQPRRARRGDPSIGGRFGLAKLTM